MIFRQFRSMPDAPKQPLVLYVDDERANRIVFEQSLKSEFLIKTVADAKSALEMLAREDVAVLVSDIRMPEVDGLELLRIAKDRHPTTLRMVITAFSDADPILRALNEGLVVRYIVKPWDREELVQALRWATELWRVGKDSAALLSRMIETERLASLGGLAALYVHDLRTPIMVVKNALDELRTVVDAVPVLHEAIAQAAIDETLKARLLDKLDVTPEIIQDTQQAFDFVANMVNVLMTYLRNQNRGSAPVIDPVPIITFTVNMFQKITVHSLAHIAYTGSKELPMVRIEPVDLTQVLVNVVKNATEAIAARGEPNRHISVEARTQGDMLELQVRDDGVGMPPEVLKKIGKPWFTT